MKLTNVRRIAVVKGSSIGDIMTGIPMLRALKQHLPHAELTLVASYRGAGEPLIRRCPYIDEYVVIGTSTARAARNVLALRRKKFDLVINGYPATARSSLLCSLLGAKHTAAVKGKEHIFGFDVVVDPAGMDATQAENELLRRIGIDEHDTALEMFANLAKGAKRVDKMLKKLEGDMLIACNFGKDGNFNRTWVDGRWADLLDMFGKKYGFVLVGGTDNARRAAFIESRTKAPIANLVGKLSLDETAYAISRCRLMLCINGGPMHIAAAMGKPIVALHGPSFQQWNPHAQRAINLGGRQLCKISCNDNVCGYGDARCIKTVSVEKVYRSALKLLRS